MKISIDRKEIIDELLEDILELGKNIHCYLSQEDGILSDYDIEMSMEDISVLDETRKDFNLVMALAEFILLDSALEISRSAAYLKAQRLACDMTQKQLASNLNIGYQNIQKWENDKLPNIINIIKLSKLLKFDINEYVKFISFGNDELTN